MELVFGLSIALLALVELQKVFMPLKCKKPNKQVKPKPIRQAYQPNLLVIQQCFSLTTNQPTKLSAMTYQPNELQGGAIRYASLALRTTTDIYIYIQELNYTG